MKTNQRKEQKEIRLQINNKKEKSFTICKQAMELIMQSKTKNIFCYVSFSDEVETHFLISQLIDNNFIVSVPCIFHCEMFAIRIKAMEDMEENLYGILQPQFDKNNIENMIGVCLAPMLGYNSELCRLGYGGGYYDKFLRDKSCMKIGLAYDEQETLFSKEEHDIPMDYLVTEKRILINYKEGK